MTPLLTPNQLASLQQTALRGMNDLVDIQRSTASDSVYGDEEAQVFHTIGQARAWFRSIPTPVATAGTGQLITINTYRLLVPVETDIRPKDQVVFGPETYVVTDTTAESTWKPYLQASLRRRE